MTVAQTLPPVEQPQADAANVDAFDNQMQGGKLDDMIDRLNHEADQEAAAAQTEEAAPPPAEEKVGSAGPSPDVIDAATWHAIQEARTEESHAEAEVDELAEDLKAAKKRLEAASLRLGKLIDEAKYPNLFNNRRDDNTPPTPEQMRAAGEAAESTGSQPVPPEDDSWRAATLEELGITKPRIVKALTDHEPPLTTLGAIADWSAAKGDFWATDISGVGEKAAQEITDRMMDYWAAHYWAAHPRAATPEPADLPTMMPGEELNQDNSPDADFDDDAIDDEAVDTVVEMPNQLVIEVAQRAGGRWASACYAFLGSKHTRENTGLDGHYPSRPAAIVAASDQVQEFIRSRGELKGNAKRRADEIVRALDQLDKKLREEGHGEAVANPQAE
jgi:hypothetical protein